jgi:hypothetical protein
MRLQEREGRNKKKGQLQREKHQLQQEKGPCPAEPVVCIELLGWTQSWIQRVFDLSSSSDPERKFSHPGCGATFPSPSLRPPRFIRLRGDRLAGSCAVLRCPLAHAANGQQHSSSCFVCDSQHHGLVQGGALAPALAGPTYPPPPLLRSGAAHLQVQKQ